MKIILNIATHGNERIGLKVAREIKKLNLDERTLAVQIANKKAWAQNKRFIDQDLNRSFPGKKNGNYEERLAYKISPIVKAADLVIDIHETTSKLKDAAIVTKLDEPTKKCLQAIRPKYALVMNATKHNALISQAKIGIAFEYGKNDKATLKKCVVGIKRLLKHLGVINIRLPKTKIATQYFNVVSTVKKPNGYNSLRPIRNYKLVRRGEAYATNGMDTIVAKENFYPILFGEKNYTDIFGFRGKKI
jgi:predicted deacylase